MGTVARPRPRILHLFSDWKWTGPAEPTVNLCRHLRRHGYVVDFIDVHFAGWHYPAFNVADSAITCGVILLLLDALLLGRASRVNS